MKAVIQRVSKASVSVSGKKIAGIQKGIVAFVGITHTDTQKEADYMGDRIVGLRCFEDENQKMNLSLKDLKGELLLVSQFTLYADCLKGRRPGFSDSARPEEARALYDYMVSSLKKVWPERVKTGQFGAKMQIDLVNDGPVTFVLEV